MSRGEAGRVSQMKHPTPTGNPEDKPSALALGMDGLWGPMFGGNLEPEGVSGPLRLAPALPRLGFLGLCLSCQATNETGIAMSTCRCMLRAPLVARQAVTKACGLLAQQLAISRCAAFGVQAGLVLSRYILRTRHSFALLCRPGSELRTYIVRCPPASIMLGWRELGDGAHFRVDNPRSIRPASWSPSSSPSQLRRPPFVPGWLAHSFVSECSTACPPCREIFDELSLRRQHAAAARDPFEHYRHSTRAADGGCDPRGARAWREDQLPVSLAPSVCQCIHTSTARFL